MRQATTCGNMGVSQTYLFDNSFRDRENFLVMGTSKMCQHCREFIGPPKRYQSIVFQNLQAGDLKQQFGA